MSPPETTRWHLYSVDEAAAILGKSRATLYRWVKGRDAVPHHRLRSGGVCFTPTDLDAILARGERGKR